MAIVLTLTLLGVELVGTALVLLACLMLSPFILWGIASGAHGGLRWGAVLSHTSPTALLQHMAVVLNILYWNLSGWDATPSFAGEVTNPHTVFPLGLGIACVLSVFTYVVPLFVGYSAFPDPQRWVGDGGMNFAVAAAHDPKVGSAALGVAVSVAAACAGIGQLLSSVTCYSFTIWRRAQDGFYPAFLSYLSTSDDSMECSDVPVQPIVDGCGMCKDLYSTHSNTHQPNEAINEDSPSTSIAPSSFSTISCRESIHPPSRSSRPASLFIESTPLMNLPLTHTQSPTYHPVDSISCSSFYSVFPQKYCHRIRSLFYKLGIRRTSSVPVFCIILLVLSSTLLALILPSLNEILVVDNLFATLVVILEIISFIVVRIKDPRSLRSFKALGSTSLPATFVVTAGPLLTLLVVLYLNVLSIVPPRAPWPAAVMACLVLLFALTGYPLWRWGLFRWCGCGPTPAA